MMAYFKISPLFDRALCLKEFAQRACGGLVKIPADYLDLDRGNRSLTGASY